MFGAGKTFGLRRISQEALFFRRVPIMSSMLSQAAWAGHIQARSEKFCPLSRMSSDE